MTLRLLLVQARKTTRPKDFISALAEAYPEVKVRLWMPFSLKELLRPCLRCVQYVSSFQLLCPS